MTLAGGGGASMGDYLGRLCLGTVLALTVVEASAAPQPRASGPAPPDVVLPLEQALRRLADQGRLQILFSAADLPQARVTLPADVGATAPAALARLLEGQPLAARRLDARTFVIFRRPKAAAAPATPVTRQAPPRDDPPTAVTPVTVLGARSPQRGSRAVRDDFIDAMAAPLALSLLSRDRYEGRAISNMTDAIASLPDTTVLTTGRSFVSGVDSATRGEGLFVGLRGLNPEFSVTLMQGAPVAQGLPHSRGVQLSMIPPEGFSEVVIHRTGRPDLEGDLIAGAIDFRPFRAGDFAKRRWLEMTAWTRSADLARRYNASGRGGGQGVLMAGRFGAQDQLGIAASLRRATRRLVSAEMAGVMSAQNDQGWAWAWSATPGPNFYGAPRDPTRPEADLALTALNTGVSEVFERSRAVMIAADWRPADDRSLSLTLVDLRSRTEQNSTLTQLVGGARRWTPDPAGGYRLSLGEVSSRVWYETNPDDVGLTVLTLAGRGVLPGHWAGRTGAWLLTPRLTLSRATSDRPDRLEASIRVNQNDAFNQGQTARPYAGLLIDSTGGFPRPRLTPELRADLDQADTRLLARRAGQRTEQHSAQDRVQAAFDVEWLDGGPLTVKAGASASASRREVTNRNWTNPPFAVVLGQAGLTWRDLGITTGETWPAVWPGVYDWRAPRVDHQALAAWFDRAVGPGSLDGCGKIEINNLNCRSQFGREVVFAAYGLVTARLGAVELMAGVRREDTAVRSRYWLVKALASGEQPGEWRSDRSRFGETLPSLFMTWRPDQGRVLRAGLWRSYSRPALYQLGGGAALTTDEQGAQVLTQGNPDLEAITAVNLDLQWLQTTRDGGWGLSAWAKRLDNILFESGGIYTGAAPRPRPGLARLITPQNGGVATVRGLQAEWVRRLRPAFDPAASFEVSGSVSRQWTQADLGSDEFGRATPMQSAPAWLANLAGVYERGPWRVRLNARYTGALLSEYNTLEAPGDWDNLWIRPVFATDLSVRYRISEQAQIETGVVNLGDALAYDAHVGRHSRVIASRVHTGRQLNLALRARF
ncbi:TonB-dependent receptor [Caulobacter vibrioides]|uniref:TonB-dependent receptor n=2 Tax=Caulobacter vibrioides TaxID=155892 RepID=Q9AAN5_CAUVC|nr:TonB-dependent receptor [Caulobacter vibrioides]YP_002515970.1 TonB-dependent receptor [Caulobacter vibrioides NA1000]AAK22548.1 TonB-dependent receptor [Caulobacter vibrioides CB15]ACL94062.1 TonB-dependent receptor [Caulobacter vibrioides NA1000]ATC27407.1 TonB-dependent receptor [Caulobacter vibrioides]QXZ52644.1 TonB-dependent receptor [Caulobacter vibrioides]